MPKLTPLCEHVFTNGYCCGSPRLKDSDFCYWHDAARARSASRHNKPAASPETATVYMPYVEDSNSLMVSLQEIMHALAENRIDRHRAGLMLYGIQCSAQILPKLRYNKTIRNRWRIRRSEEGEDLSLPQTQTETPKPQTSHDPEPPTLTLVASTS